MESLDDRMRRVVQEHVAIVEYDPEWPRAFRREREHLLSCLPAELIGRIEHFGSTAVPGLAAKPIVDMLVETTDLEAAKRHIVPILESQGYDYFWRPTAGDGTPPFYAWFIKRDPVTRARTHHIHMVERHFQDHWDRLVFRDYLIAHPLVAAQYESLKLRLAAEYAGDRVAYTAHKTEFILRVTDEAKRSAVGSDDEWIAPYAPQLQRFGRILELGCGSGRDTEDLVALGDVVGIDLSPRSLRECRRNAPTATLICADLSNPLPIRTGAFPAVIASLCIHYFSWETTRRLVADIRRAMIPGGLLVVRVNSTKDENHGATGHPEIEPNFYKVGGFTKRFFDRQALADLFGDWEIESMTERVIKRYEEPKWIWELSCRA